MNPRVEPEPPSALLAKDDFQQLLDLLRGEGYQVVGPTIDQGAIVYGPIERVDDLPRGWTDEQEAGHYRLRRRDDDAWFGFSVGPHSWKAYFFPPRTPLVTSRLVDGLWEMEACRASVPRFALLGVRACEIAALRVQDRVFIEGACADPVYAARRREALIVAVDCTQAAPTCFCTSMGTGPQCTSGFDLALVELAEAFVASAGSQRGGRILEQLPTRPATAGELAEAGRRRQQARHDIRRRLDTEGIRDALVERLEHPRYDDVAGRCLSCANCTLVCPTCFCHSVEEVADLTSQHVTRERKWDSCFNVEFSHLTGGPVRNEIRWRYRQWLVHKLATWFDQFGTSGCVGCGRCITWCPTAIDLTEEVAAIRAAPS